MVGRDRAELGVKLKRVVTFSGLDNLCPPTALKNGKFSSELLNLKVICTDPIFWAVLVPLFAEEKISGTCQKLQLK